MLTSLSVQNYTIVEKLELEFQRGMTVITGETGAGKSIMLDALGLALGDRADGSAVRPGGERTDISACFDLHNLEAARSWLQARELDDGDDCLLRRTVSGEGRSKAFINGRPATANDLRELGDLLVDIHSQHEHQSLLRKDTHRQLLDQAAEAQPLAREVAALARSWAQQREQLQHLRNHSREATAHQQLLSFQLDELTALGLAPREVEQLEHEQRQLAHAEDILRHSHDALALCRDNDQANATSLLARAIQRLEEQAAHHPALGEALELLNSAAMQLDEGTRQLQRHLDSVELNPARLQIVEERLGAIFQLARKHKLPGRELHTLAEQLQRELAGLDASDERLNQWEVALAQLQQQWQSQAQQLSRVRQRAARQLADDVMAQLGQLGMASCRLEVALHPRPDEHPHPQGAEEVELLISSNPGQPAGPLAKIASGGELSRISLAIQVVAARVSRVPTLVFDEVDVGIGGRVADVVGQLLRRLGERGQVICVTHLPQVAAKGHQHLRVAKHSAGALTRTQLDPLQGEEKVEEIARMLGGVTITEQTRAHAREMLALSAD